MSENENSESGFKIKDKRRFDASGNLKGSEEAKVAASPQEKKVEASPNPKKDEITPEGLEELMGGGGVPQLNFSSFVMSLATQAMMQIGEIPAPEGVDVTTDLRAAKQTIDIISILNEKTNGNLDATEEKIMTEVMHSLKLAFVKHSTK